MRTLLLLALLLSTVAPAHAGQVKIVDIKADPDFLDIQIIDAKNVERDAKVGELLKESDRVRTGYKTEAVIDFDGKATVRIEELSEFRIGLFRLGDVAQMELLLKVGAIQAQVHRKELRPTRFTVKTPTVTASVRGTILRIAAVPQMGSQAWLLTGDMRASVKGLQDRDMKGHETLKKDADLAGVIDQRQITDRDSRTLTSATGLTPGEVQATLQQPIVAQASPGLYSGGLTNGLLPGTAPSACSGCCPMPSSFLFGGFDSFTYTLGTFHNDTTPMPIAVPANYGSHLLAGSRNIISLMFPATGLPLANFSGGFTATGTPVTVPPNSTGPPVSTGPNEFALYTVTLNFTSGPNAGLSANGATAWIQYP